MPDLIINDKAKINKDYHPGDKEQELRKWVYKRKHDMEYATERQRMEKEWNAGEKAWDGYRKEKGPDDWQSDYYIPLTTAVIESILAEVVDQSPRPLILPRGAEDAPKATIVKHAFNYTWDVANGDEEIQKVFKGALIRGTRIAQEYYLKDRRLVRDVQGFHKNKRKTVFDTKEREVFEHDDPMMEEVSLWDLFVDEKARDFNRGNYKARDCIRRYIMNYRDAKIQFSGDVWNPMGNFRFVKPGGNTDYYQFYTPPTGIDHGEDVEVLWYWARKPEDLQIVIINDVVVVMGPNRYKHKQLPFARAVDVSRLDHFYGKGEPKLLSSVQEELNTIRRMTIDRHHLDIDKTFIVPPSLSLDEQELIARPHGLIVAENPKDVMPLEYGDIPVSVQLTQKAIQEDAVRVTGVDDRVQSLAKTPSTATEAAILKESTLKRIRMKIRSLENGFLTDIARMRVANILQFYSQPKLESIVGQAGTAEYQREMARLAREGLLTSFEGKPMKKQFKQIPIQGKELAPDATGNFAERTITGTSFFTLKPEFFMPVARAGYDIRFEAGAELPISKPLMQSKMQEMFDRLLPIAVEGITTYDPEKLADMLVKINDMNPQELKKEQGVEEAGIESQRLEMAIDLAGQENQAILGGKPIPPNGTPYAPPSHTMVHIGFLKSPQMKQASEDIYKQLLAHVVGEMQAQTLRQGGTGLTASAMGTPGGAQGTPNQPQHGQSAPMSMGSPPTAPGAMNNIIPGMIEGGMQVPTGKALGG